uniref:glycerophosphocholine cholinephosphodiesterase n=1 Tax=Schistosoma japonicum TaxID=6182 RepID=C1LJM9_SCHJA|nr:Ectonucleotide pyrophosphatase/phosphodiesterase family member 6 precursor [Schistosoma japonicum]
MNTYIFLYILVYLFNIKTSVAIMPNLDYDLSNSTTSRLLVLLIDGLRWDVIASHLENNTSEFGFKRLQKHGAYLERVTPVFPAECYPNIYSLFTGRHPIDHGVILPTTFNGLTTVNNKPIRSRAESIWETGVKQNKGVHLYHLPICSAETDSESSWYCEPYNQKFMNPIDLNFTIQKAVTGLQNGSANLAVVYYDELDRIGHRYGPLSDQLIHKHLVYLDHVVNYMLNIVESIPNLNILLTSDHGMSTVSHEAHADRYLKGTELSRVLNRGSTLWIWPKPEYEANVYNRLLSQQSRSPFTVYNVSTIPSHWEIATTNNNSISLFPPILLIASPDYIFESTVWPLNMSHYNLIKPKGMHGYDPELSDMQIPLFIYGPNSNRGIRLNFTKNIRPIHIHSLIAYLASINLPDFDSLNLFTPLLLPHHHQPLPSSSYLHWSWNENSSFPLLSFHGDRFMLSIIIGIVVLSCFFVLAIGLLIIVYIRCRFALIMNTRVITCDDELDKELVKSEVLPEA